MKFLAIRNILYLHTGTGFPPHEMFCAKQTASAAKKTIKTTKYFMFRGPQLSSFPPKLTLIIHWVRAADERSAIAVYVDCICDPGDLR